ncbi:MAG: CBS domain-containing protein [Anaerolinea sp.]|nr:CBS domain-containing protein [Anaerolinea sp.]MCC6976320.1 CBS domain-containing protein [Anaerolineae bacterium]
MMLVGQHMVHHVHTVSPTTNYREARELMKTWRIRRLPVVEHGRLVGIISEKDLLLTAPSPATTLSVYEIYTLLDKLEVKQFMKHPVITVGPDCPLQDAAQIMLTNKIGCLPVMRAGDLAGIITETDIMRVLVNLLGGGEPGLNFTVRIKDEPGTLASVASAVAQAGGNIVSITSSPHSGEVNIKEQGANIDKLRQLLREAGAELVQIQNGQPHTPQMFG